MVSLNLAFLVFFLPSDTSISLQNDFFHMLDGPIDIHSSRQTSRIGNPLSLSHLPALSPFEPPDQTQKRKKPILKMVTITALTVCLISTASAYYYISEADAAYDRYLYAGNPDEMNRFFQQSKTFDRRAGYSFLIFETSFFISLFSFLFTLEQ